MLHCQTCSKDVEPTTAIEPTEQGLARDSHCPQCDSLLARQLPETRQQAPAPRAPQSDNVVPLIMPGAGAAAQRTGRIGPPLASVPTAAAVAIANTPGLAPAHFAFQETIPQTGGELLVQQIRERLTLVESQITSRDALVRESKMLRAMLRAAERTR